MMYVMSMRHPSPPRKRGSRLAPGKEQGATAKAVGPRIPAFEAVIQLRNLELSLSYPSFPRKREPRDFSHPLLGPRFRGDDELACPQDFLTPSFAGMTNNLLVLRNSFSFGL